jgi:hypothetical protein
MEAPTGSESMALDAPAPAAPVAAEAAPAGNEKVSGRSDLGGSGVGSALGLSGAPICWLCGACG